MPVSLRGLNHRRLLGAEPAREWRANLRQINLSARQIGVGIPNGAEHVGLRARTHDQAKHWVFFLECSKCLRRCHEDGGAKKLAVRAPGQASFAAKC